MFLFVCVKTKWYYCYYEKLQTTYHSNSWIPINQ